MSDKKDQKVSKNKIYKNSNKKYTKKTNAQNQKTQSKKTSNKKEVNKNRNKTPKAPKKPLRIYQSNQTQPKSPVPLDHRALNCH